MAISNSGYQVGTTSNPSMARRVLAAVSGQVAAPSPLIGQASLTTAMAGSNNDMVFTADGLGTPGNAVTIAFVVAGASTPLSVSVSGSAITVNVATTSGSAASSTANQVIAALQANDAVNKLVSVGLAAANDGTGVVAAFSATPLAGGTDRTIGTESNAPLPTIPPIHYTYGQ